MTLDNLLKIGQLKPHAPDAAEIGLLLEAARRTPEKVSLPNTATTLSAWQ